MLRHMWKYTGKVRPPFAESPGPGQESVWDYPRPPAVEIVAADVEVRAGEQVIARSDVAIRVLETASPPSVYLPASAVTTELLVAVPQTSVCEWKGRARYFALEVAPTGAEGVVVAWCYRRPVARFSAIDGAFSFYPGRVACFWNGERVLPQPGEFYGGWITSSIVGPVKGGPGTGGW